MNVQVMDTAQVLQKFEVDDKQGLSNLEVGKRQKVFGKNEIIEGRKQSALVVLINQFKDFMVVILLVATVISGLLGEFVDAIAIVAIVILNGFLGFFQERKAEKSLSALKKLGTPQAQVLREGNWVKLPSREITVGDIIRFSAGDKIAADVRILTVASLEIEESPLTGESLPIAKSANPMLTVNNNLGDQTNMAFMGTLVTRGSGTGVVVASGMKTAMGRIARMLETAESGQTPLQHRLEQLGKVLIIAALLLTLLVVAIGILQGNPIYTMILAGVSLAVAAIPEGLPAIVTVALSLGVQRMIRQNALVRKLPAVETLGCASIICSDKTGTMTENKMTVREVWTSGGSWEVSGVGFNPKGEFTPKGHNGRNQNELMQLLTFGALCNHAELKKTQNHYLIEGDPTEGAMLVAAMKLGIERQDLKEQFTIIKEFPFDATRKLMSILIQDESGKQFIVTKGAPDVLLNRSVSVLWEGRVQTLHTQFEKIINQELKKMNEQALRTIAIAYKSVTLGNKIETESEAEKNLIFIGIEAMIDPPRPEVKMAVRKCHEAGIKTVMITGDHAITAVAIASQLDIYHKNDLFLTGNDLDQMDEDELCKKVSKTSVFARVSPEHKLKIVKAFQQNGHIVAMTGDGVNDAPAIKAADIGISMGITGTDVAKETSSLILLDDHFATIKAAINEGRNIYENIRKFIRYLLASNVGEILVMLFAMILALPLPLLPIQILWINLVTDGLPAMALGLDRPEDNVMKRPPRHPKEGVFARRLGWKIISRGFLIGGSTIFAFLTVYQSEQINLVYAQTIAFATLILAQLIHVFDCRSEKSIFARNPFGNKYLVGAVISSLMLTLLVIYYPPLQNIFHTIPITLRDWLLVIVMASLPTFLLAGSVFIRRGR